MNFFAVEKRVILTYQSGSAFSRTGSNFVLRLEPAMIALWAKASSAASAKFRRHERERQDRPPASACPRRSMKSPIKSSSESKLHAETQRKAASRGDEYLVSLVCCRVISFIRFPFSRSQSAPDARQPWLLFVWRAVGAENSGLERIPFRFAHILRPRSSLRILSGKSGPGTRR